MHHEGDDGDEDSCGEDGVMVSRPLKVSRARMKPAIELTTTFKKTALAEATTELKNSCGSEATERALT